MDTLKIFSIVTDTLNHTTTVQIEASGWLLLLILIGFLFYFFIQQQKI